MNVNISTKPRHMRHTFYRACTQSTTRVRSLFVFFLVVRSFGRSCVLFLFYFISFFFSSVGSFIDLSKENTRRSGWSCSHRSKVIAASVNIINRYRKNVVIFAIKFVENPMAKSNIYTLICKFIASTIILLLSSVRQNSI